LPTVGYQCGSPGCADAGFPLECLPLSFTASDGGTYQESKCVQPCKHTLDCADISTTCLTNVDNGVCYYNFCPSGALPYSLCDAEGTNDGQC
jgi:hypothetical protein